MINKFISILIFSLISASSFAKSFRVGSYEYETVKKGLYANEVKLKKDFSSNTDAIIPETISYEGRTYIVGIIDNDAFKENKRIMNVQIPGTIHEIGMNAFKGLKTLRKVIALPEAIKLKEAVEKRLKEKPNLLPADLAIGFCAFANCENLDSLDFSQRKTIVLVPKNLYGTKAWGFSYPFQNCKSLKSIVFGDVIFSDVGMKIFKGCHNLSNVVTSTANPSQFKKLFEDDCPFITEVYPKISTMTDSEYLVYLEDMKKHKSNTINTLTTKGDEVVSDNVNSTNNNDSQFRTTMDIMSVPMQRKDNNGNVCALLKVYSTQNNLSFEGNMIGNIEYKNHSQYWIYLSPGSQKIKIITPGIDPVELAFIDYGVHHLESKKIYEYSHNGIPTQKINIFFTPIEATVLIDGVIYDGDNGIVSADLPLGEHSYIVASRGYVTAEGVVKLKSDGQSNLNITLPQTSK